MSDVKSRPLPPIDQADKERFWGKVAITANPNRCWKWIGYVRRRGYGSICITLSPGKEVNVVATRLSYYLHHGVDPVGFAVCHTCDDPGCVNPNHLFLGTNKENTDDMMKKERNKVFLGSKHGQAKLTEEVIEQIRLDLRMGYTQTEIGRKYGVYQSVISRIKNGKAWTHI